MFAFVSSFFAFAHAEGPLRDENAALQYYQAFLTMPADEQLSEKEKKILEESAFRIGAARSNFAFKKSVYALWLRAFFLAT